MILFSFLVLAIIIIIFVSLSAIRQKTNNGNNDDTSSSWPFRDVEIRVGDPGSQGARAALYVLEGHLPLDKKLPLNLDVSLSSVDDKTNGKLLYKDLVIESLSTPLLLDTIQDHHLLDPDTRLNVLITNSSSTFYSGEVAVKSSAPNVQTVFVSNDTVLVQITEHKSFVTYPSGDEYVKEFPMCMPKQEQHVEQKLVFVTRNDGLDGPFTRLIYGETAAATATSFDRTTYKSLAEANTVPTRVFVIENPARPGEKYVVLRASPPANVTLLGWSVGFAGSDRGGINFVFPQSLSSPSLEFLTKDAPSTTLYNTKTAVGIFINDNDSSSNNNNNDGITPEFFKRGMVPFVVVRPDTGQLIALVHSPVSASAPPPTRLLPRNTLAPIPMPPHKPPPPFAVTVIGGTSRTQTSLSSPPPPPPDHLVAISSLGTLFRITRVICTTSSSLPVRATVSVPRTGLVEQTQTAVVPGDTGLIVLDGVKDDDTVIVQSVLVPVRAMPMTTGVLHEVRFFKNSISNTNSTSTSTNNAAVPQIIICRTTSPPVNVDGHRPPQNLAATGLSFFYHDTQVVPKWAFKGSWKGWGRHVFALSLRDAKIPMVAQVLRRIMLDIVRDVEASSPKPGDYEHYHEYNRGALEHARKALGAAKEDRHHDAVHQAASANDAASSVGLWVLGADGTRREKLLHDSYIVEPWGLLVFGANPGPPGPADEEGVVGWRKFSPLSLNGGSGLPLRPVEHRLPVWTGGDPVHFIGDTKRAIVRLDFDKVSVGPTSYVLQIRYNKYSGSVYSIHHLRLRWAATKPDDEPTTLSEAERAYPETAPDNPTIACVITQPVSNTPNVENLLVDPLVILCIARVPTTFDEMRTFRSLLEAKPNYQVGAINVPSHLSTIAGFRI